MENRSFEAALQQPRIHVRRADEPAIPGNLEMRKVSALVYSHLQNEAPCLLSDFELTVYDDGYPLVHRKAMK